MKQTDRQQADFERLSLGVVDMMARLCAPARDAAVAGLRDEADLVKRLRFLPPFSGESCAHGKVVDRGIMETVSLMKADMANFALAAAKPVVKEHSVAYERDKFAAALAASGGTEAEALRETTAWLRAAREALASDPPQAKATTAGGTPSKAAVVVEAFLLLLRPPAENRPVPEVISTPFHGPLSMGQLLQTLAMDEERLAELRSRLLQLTITTAAVLASAAAAERPLAPDFKKDLKAKLEPLLQGVKQR